MLKAVARHTDQKWVVMYVERWLKAPMQRSDGTLVPRVRGTPQGSPISPCLANLFLHYGLDAWMVREFPTVQFERFADDAVIHCVSESQARLVRDAVACRLVAVGLELHPVKTRIVYCKDSNRRGDYEEISLGRAGARSRRYGRSVSPTRPPNPLCRIQHNGLYVPRTIMLNTRPAACVLPAQSNSGWRAVQHNRPARIEARAFRIRGPAARATVRVGRRGRLLKGVIPYVAGVLGRDHPVVAVA